MSTIKRLKVLFISMGLFGLEGGVINERELAKALSKKVTLYVLTFLSVNKYHRYLKDARNLRKSLNHRLVILPNFIPPPVNDLFALVNLFFTYINSAVAMLLAVTLKKIGLIDAIYVRDPRTAIAFVSPKKVTDALSVKFAGFYTQDMTRPASIVGDFVVNFFRRINYIVVNKADLLIVQSSLYKQALKMIYSLSDEKPLIVIPAGINLEEIPKSPSYHKGLTHEYRIGFVGSISKWSGVDILMEAMCIVKKVFPNAVFYATIGSGDPAIINKLKVRARQLSLKTVFYFAVSHKKALEIMSRLHVLVVPRRRYLSAELTIPIKVIEAFALGIPVIITRHKIFEEKYNECEDILLVEPKPEDLAQKIIMLLNNPSLVKKISERELLNSREFDYNNIASRLADALYELVKISRRHRGQLQGTLTSYEHGEDRCKNEE